MDWQVLKFIASFPAFVKFCYISYFADGFKYISMNFILSDTFLLNWHSISFFTIFFEIFNFVLNFFAFLFFLVIKTSKTARFMTWRKHSWLIMFFFNAIDFMTAAPSVVKIEWFLMPKKFKCFRKIFTRFSALTVYEILAKARLIEEYFAWKFILINLLPALEHRSPQQNE